MPWNYIVPDTWSINEEWLKEHHFLNTEDNVWKYALNFDCVWMVVLNTDGTCYAVELRKGLTEFKTSTYDTPLKAIQALNRRDHEQETEKEDN